jgi:DNA-binding MarR family transcriptional regulator/GNAT superfamily N-acetyltransferase
MNQPGLDEGAAVFRRFNRFYTKKIGVLGERLLDSPFALAEARLLFELASREKAGRVTYASDLRAELALDGGYLSRLLSRFERQGIPTRRRGEDDARRRSLRLEAKGWALFAELDALANDDATRTLAALGGESLNDLVEALKTVERILGGEAAEPWSCALREPGPGDMGWVISAHGEIYTREYGRGPEFEALVARIVADFASSHDPVREKAWIAWAEGRRVGSVFLVQVDQDTAKLRLLILAPQARGHGLGKRLVEECIAFAGSVGYSKLVLWTNDSLVAARSIYAKAGFRIVASEPELNFGQGTRSETWELELKPSQRREGLA